MKQANWREKFIQKTPFDLRLGVMIPEDASLTGTMVDVVSYDSILHYKVVGEEPLDKRIIRELERRIAGLGIPGTKHGMCVITVPSMLTGDKLNAKYAHRVTINLNAVYKLDTPCKANKIPTHITETMKNEITRVWNDIAEWSGLEPIRNKYKENDHG